MNRGSNRLHYFGKLLNFPVVPNLFRPVVSLLELVSQILLLALFWNLVLDSFVEQERCVLNFTPSYQRRLQLAWSQRRHFEELVSIDSFFGGFFTAIDF